MNRHRAARLGSAPAERSDDGAVDHRGRWYFPVAPPDEERCRASLATLPAVTSTVKAGALHDAVAPTERSSGSWPASKSGRNRWLPMNQRFVRCPAFRRSALHLSPVLGACRGLGPRLRRWLGCILFGGWAAGLSAFAASAANFAAVAGVFG
jgi:hypothetical protein